MLILTTMCVAGCGSRTTTIPVRGEVHYNGQPLQDGIVIYMPKNVDEARQATGRIGRDGSFVLTTFKSGDGVVPGEYNIVIYEAYTTRSDQPKSRAEHEAAAQAGKLKPQTVLPQKYVNPQTSGLSDTVDSDHSGFKRLELKG